MAQEVHFFSENHRKMCNEEVFELVRVRIEKQASETQRKLKINVWNLDLAQNISKEFFIRARLRATGVKLFSGLNQEMHRGDFFKLVGMWVEKQVFGVRKKGKIRLIFDSFCGVHGIVAHIKVAESELPKFCKWQIWIFFYYLRPLTIQNAKNFILLRFLDYLGISTSFLLWPS